VDNCGELAPKFRCYVGLIYYVCSGVVCCPGEEVVIPRRKKRYGKSHFDYTLLF